VSVSVPAAEPGVGTAIDEIARRHGVRDGSARPAVAHPRGMRPRADRYRGRHSRDGGVPLAVGVRAHGAGRLRGGNGCSQ
jgi:hypothetical protein